MPLVPRSCCNSHLGGHHEHTCPDIVVKQEKSCDRSCAHWSYDMDGEYCTHPKSLEIAPVFGAGTNRMSVEGHCMTDKYGNTPDVAYALWEART